MRKSIPKGFTLIELLVVVAIIALLISLLLPSLAKAKEVSRRSVCLANLHAIGTGLHIYGDLSRDQVPLGIYTWPNDWDYGAQDWREGSYLYWGNASGASGIDPNFNADFFGLGRLYQIGAVMAQKSYFCPSGLVNGALPSAFTLTHGQWPPMDIRNQAGLWPAGQSLSGMGWPASYSGYSRRPCPPRNNMTWGNSTLVSWRMYVPSGPPYDVVPENTGGYTAKFPTFAELGSMAIVADLAGGKLYVDGTHKDGMNVLYGDGSARWVPAGVMKDPATGATHLDPLGFNKGFTWGGAGTEEAKYSQPLWEDFDRN